MDENTIFHSLYSSINAFLDIENELEKDMKCALVGDFNAKVAAINDAVEKRLEDNIQ
jgi:hypothetical protein